jgi:hypothetical protein
MTLEELRHIAAAATPGTWDGGDAFPWVITAADDPDTPLLAVLRDREGWEQDQVFLETFHPERAQRLLRRLAEFRMELEVAKGLVQDIADRWTGGDLAGALRRADHWAGNLDLPEESDLDL